MGVSVTFMDNIYRVDQVDNDGTAGIVTVYSNVISVVGIATTSVTPNAIGFNSTGRVGNYSWGKFYNFQRKNRQSFSAENENGFAGIQTSPIVVRKSALRAEYN